MVGFLLIFTDDGCGVVVVQSIYGLQMLSLVLIFYLCTAMGSAIDSRLKIECDRSRN